MNSPKVGPTTDQGKAVASRNATQITALYTGFVLLLF